MTPPEMDVPESTLRRALDDQLCTLLPSLVGWLAVLYGLQTLLNLASEQAVATPHWLVPMAVVKGVQVSVGLVYVALYVAMRWLPPTARTCHLVAFVVGAMPLVDSLLHLYSRQDPLETLSYVIVLLGASQVFTSRRWFFSFWTLALAAWIVVAPRALPSREFLDVLVVMLQAGLLSAVLFVLRWRALRRLERLRWLAEERGTRLDAQNQRLLELDRLKSEFVNAVSHDLRTPLTSIKGFTEFLSDDVGGTLTATQREFVGYIERSTRRLQRLVNDLLDFAQIEAGTFQLRLTRQDVGLLVGDLARSFQPLLTEARLRLAIELPDTPLWAWVDPQRLDQVLSNLLYNAVKFTPAGGIITVRLTQVPEGLRVAIADTGPGISEADQARLFRRFSQLDGGREKGGTGLGLSIARAIVEAHGGTIGVTSTPGAGTTFWFVLRCESDEAV